MEQQPYSITQQCQKLGIYGLLKVLVEEKRVMNGSKGPFLLVPGFILAPGFALATDFMHFFLTMSGNVENKVEIGKNYLPRVSLSPNLFPKKCNIR